jgi:hypothetical protein
VKTLDQVRDDVVAYVRSQLVGPYGGQHEVIADTPNRRYLMGILFPRNVAADAYAEEEGEEIEPAAGAAAGGDENLFGDDPVSAANDFLPASQGISFFTSAAHITVELNAGRYETLEGAAAESAVEAATNPVDEPTERQDGDPRRKSRRVWRRIPLETERVPVTGKTSTSVFGGRGRLEVRWRPLAGRSLVTVTLMNAAEAAAEVKVDSLWDDMLLQASFVIRVDDGEILEYPNLDAARHDPEEDELRLQHRGARTYAIGHGCAPMWKQGENVLEVSSDVMPWHVVPSIRAAGGGDGAALDIAWLADHGVPAKVLYEELSTFVAAYEEWIRGQRKLAAGLARAHERDAAARILSRLDRAAIRIRRGAVLLRDDPVALRAFRFANEAMLRQMRHSKKDLAGARRARYEAAVVPSTYAPGPRWHAFQLGFALLALEGLAGPDEENERDIVDLIWFPTGGGKTEAYLLLAAFEIFRRRVADGERGGGTAVLSRYTLTLLTAQQFQRAATTICACERIRAENEAELGEEPVSIGLWVGEGTTPNRYKMAREHVDQLREANVTDDRFLLERCPWCGTEILPREHNEDSACYGITATDTSFAFNCPSSHCPFNEALPVHVVDDDLYEHPPTFLLGTVDKFAGLAWEHAAGNLFGRPVKRIPPSLIIQDELHLLTGPLGTTMGLYEVAIDRLCEYQGRLPKVVSSTATIRRAPDQVLGLFGRPVELFPPSGLTADESYFASVNPDRGRLYVGLMAQGHTSDTATVHSLAAMLQAPLDLALSGPELDAYWTLVAYHSSLRELGRTVTLARDDAAARLQALVKGRKVRAFEVEELTSNIERSQQPRLLERLNLTCHESGNVEVLATTNMLSVGVDIPRLGLMLMNGQPKATSEYIQATSRVGRAHHPGLVFSLFRSTRPRDRSHYENFVPYHGALYRYVEPTSVTPFSPRSRDRALHATLVILVRHHLMLARDDAAGRIVDHLPQVNGYIDQIVAVTKAAEPREASRTRAELEYFRDEWADRAREAANAHKQLYYKSQGKGHYNLLQDFGAKGNAWPTLRSMRNVDRECVLDVAKGQASPPSGGSS